MRRRCCVHTDPDGFRCRQPVEPDSYYCDDHWRILQQVACHTPVDPAYIPPALKARLDGMLRAGLADIEVPADVPLSGKPASAEEVKRMWRERVVEGQE